MPILGFWGFGDPPWPIGTDLRWQKSSTIPPLIGPFKGEGVAHPEGGQKGVRGSKNRFFLFSPKCPWGSSEARRRSKHSILTIFGTKNLTSKTVIFSKIVSFYTHFSQTGLPGDIYMLFAFKTHARVR